MWRRIRGATMPCLAAHPVGPLHTQYAGTLVSDPGRISPYSRSHSLASGSGGLTCCEWLVTLPRVDSTIRTAPKAMFLLSHLFREVSEYTVLAMCVLGIVAIDTVEGST